MMSSYTEKQKLQLAFIVILLLVWVRFALIPWHEWRSELVESIAQSKRSYRDPTLHVESREKLDHAKEQLNKQKDELYSKLFVVKDSQDLDLKLRAYIEKTSKDEGIAIKRSVKRGASESNKLYKSTLQITFTALPQDAERFLNHIEKSEKALRVEQLNVSKNGNSLDVSMSLSGWGRSL